MAMSVMPSAEIVFDTLFAYQRSAALKTAIDLDLFTAIDAGATAPALAYPYWLWRGFAERKPAADVARSACRGGPALRRCSGRP